MKNHLHTKERFTESWNGYSIYYLASCCFNSSDCKISIIHHPKQKK